MGANRKTDGEDGRWPVLSAIAAQLIAGALVLAAAKGGGAFGLSIHLQAILAAQGVLAALIGHGFKLDWWWAPIHLAVPYTIWGALALGLPGWVYPTAFFALLLVFAGAGRDRVPLYLSNRKTIDALAALLPKQDGFQFIDLGCGLGGPLRELARQRPDGMFEGIETAPLSYAAARLRLWRSPNARVRFGDLWSGDLSRHDTVYCFLSPQPMPRLYKKARAEMKPGALLISNSFEVPGHPADEIIEVGDRRQTKLLLWRM